MAWNDLPDVSSLPAGWFTDADILSYRQLYDSVRVGGFTCEVGAYEGRSLCAVADIIKERVLTVHVVDLFGENTDGTGGPSHLGAFAMNAHKFGILDHLVIHPHISSDKVLLRRLPLLDLVFIDGDHNEQAVEADLNLYIQALRWKTGILAGHDYIGAYPGVKKIVDGIYEDAVELMPHSIWKVTVSV